MNGVSLLYTFRVWSNRFLSVLYAWLSSESDPEPCQKYSSLEASSSSHIPLMSTYLASSLGSDGSWPLRLYVLSALPVRTVSKVGHGFSSQCRTTGDHVLNCLESASFGSSRACQHHRSRRPSFVSQLLAVLRWSRHWVWSTHFDSLGPRQSGL